MLVRIKQDISGKETDSKWQPLLFTRRCLSCRTEGQSVQSLGDKGGGLGSEVNSSQAGQMERQSCGKQLEPTTAGLEPSASSTRSSKGALGLTQRVPSLMRQLPTLLLAQMSVLYGNSKIWPQSKWLLRAVCSQTLAGLHRGSGLGPLRTPKGSERQGLG